MIKTFQYFYFKADLKRGMSADQSEGWTSQKDGIDFGK